MSQHEPDHQKSQMKRWRYSHPRAVRLLALLLVLVLLTVMDFCLRTIGQSGIQCSAVSSANGSPMPCTQSTKERVVIYLPGVMADATISAVPIIKAWLQYGDVQLINYIGDRFFTGAVANQVSGLLLRDLETYKRVDIYAESFGGFIAAAALAELGDKVSPAQRGRMRIILGDCPSGRETIKGPVRLAPWFYPGPIANVLADGAFGLVHVVGKVLFGTPGPIYWSWSSASSKPKQIEAGVDETAMKEFQRSVSAGAALSTFADQLRYMATTTIDLSGFHDIDLVYIMNQEEFDQVVLQPKAAQDWIQLANNANVKMRVVPLNFASNHSDYSAWPSAWSELFATLLAG